MVLGSGGFTGAHAAAGLYRRWGDAADDTMLSVALRSAGLRRLVLDLGGLDPSSSAGRPDPSDLSEFVRFLSETAGLTGYQTTGSDGLAPVFGVLGRG